MSLNTVFIITCKCFLAKILPLDTFTETTGKLQPYGRIEICRLVLLLLFYVPIFNGF